MLRVIFLTLILWLGSIPALAQDESRTDRILLVVSSHGRDGGATQPGFEMDELSQAWLVLRDNGFAVDIASPTGGAVEADKYDPEKPYNAAFLTDAIAQEKLASTLMLAPGMTENYDGVLVIGGKGAMMDLPFSQILQKILFATHERGGVIAAVCHGPAVFARMRNEDGSHFIAGRTLGGFTDEEERNFGKEWVPQFPFLLESELRRIGANFSESPIMTPHVAVDGRIVTGQNPFSVARTADELIRALGRTPKQRKPWADERSMELVRLLAEGDRAPLTQALAEDHTALDPMLIIAWGYYQSIDETIDRKTLAQAITAMELANTHVSLPQIEKAITAAQTRLESLPQ